MLLSMPEGFIREIRSHGTEKRFHCVSTYIVKAETWTIHRVESLYDWAMIVRALLYYRYEAKDIATITFLQPPIDRRSDIQSFSKLFCLTSRVAQAHNII